MSASVRRVAVVHEWFEKVAGSEKVVEQILRLYPDADLFGVVDFLTEDERVRFQHKPITTTFIQRLPMARKRFRAYLPLMPIAIEQLDLSAYDIVISSSHAVAKGVITGPNQLHVSYVHSPIRYAWDLQHQYLVESGNDKGPKSWLVRYLLKQIRGWDVRTEKGVDHFIANSSFIRRRIQKVYRRDATVIFPPVDIDSFSPKAEKEDFYLTASRLVPYKRVPLIVEAFRSLPDRRLVVIGDGPDMARIRANCPPNVELLGEASNDDLRSLMQRARAYIFAAEEDFGITPVEAQAAGTPVVAFGSGGVRDSVVVTGGPSERTGIFFDEQTPAAIIDAIRRFENEAPPLPSTCRRNAERFSTEAFRSNFSNVVEQAWTEFCAHA